MRAVFWLIVTLSPCGLYAQSFVQTVRGTVTDAFTQRPVAFAKVVLLDVDPAIAALTDENGQYQLLNVPVGRHDIAFSHPAFEGITKPGVLVSSARETVLNVRLEEALFEMEAVTLVPPRDKGRADNEMAAVSALSFDAEETRKFAGGLDDPTRVAANFAGVVPSPFFSLNTISVRGNSPRGLLYRVGGVEVPNPNHFARIGSSGGTFTLFSTQLLAQSDFYTGAFPAEFGNATAGVFDIEFRNGNNKRNEYTLQLGVLGVDLAAEGPFRKGGTSSYLFNYRFSTLTVANLLIRYNTLPEFQDLSFKLNFPTAKAGVFGVFGMSGQSRRIRPAETDSSLWERNLDRFRLILGSNTVTAGITHALPVGSRSVWRSALVASYSGLRDDRDFLNESGEYEVRDQNRYRGLPLSFSTSFKHTFNPRWVSKSGVILNYSWQRQNTLNYDYLRQRADTLVNDERAGAFRAEAYSQLLYRASDKWSFHGGLHYMYYSLNGRQILEPRAGINFQPWKNHTLGAGYGLHSRVEDFATYVSRFPAFDGRFSQPNRQLDFTKSHHFVLSYYGRLSERFRLRAEAYRQWLFDVPVQPGRPYSVVNLEELIELRELANEGKAYNMGLDLGFERFTENYFYYIWNISVYDSRYQGGDGVWRNTAYNNRFKSNLLMGKEFAVSQQKGLSRRMGINLNISVFGGQRYTPIDLYLSELAEETVFDEARYFDSRDPALATVDLTFTLRTNRSRRTGTWAVQVKNLYATRAPEIREYDALLRQVVEDAGSGIVPLISYKLEF